ncbi:MAG: helix-turn-helix domain-containing protein [Actinomycetota bacterium]|nr:helix-turn-helix domain-containing protein [Actinomycetota bacterium]
MDPDPVDNMARWFADVLRFARRDTDLSQRQLARYSGVPKSTIADIETASVDVSLRIAALLLATTGFEVLIRGPDGQLVDCLLENDRRDRGGRRFPAHLDLIPRRESAGWLRSLSAAIRYRPAGWTFRLDRRVRDNARAFGYYGEGGCLPRIPRTPTRADVDSWQRDGLLCERPWDHGGFWCERP